MSAENLSYKEYHGSVEVSVDDGVLHGHILFINDLVTYEADTVEQLREEFVAAVDDYLETCREIGKEPDKEFKGTFNVRVGPETHKAATIAARLEGISLNEFTRRALNDATKGQSEVVHRHIHEYRPTTYAVSREQLVGDCPGGEGWSIHGT